MATLAARAASSAPSLASPPTSSLAEAFRPVDPLAEALHGLRPEPPMHSLRIWRMQVTAQRLKQGTTSVGDVAEQLGYNSEAAFNRASRKTIGQTPGAVRRQGASPVQD